MTYTDMTYPDATILLEYCIQYVLYIFSRDIHFNDPFIHCSSVLRGTATIQIDNWMKSRSRND